MSRRPYLTSGRLDDLARSLSADETSVLGHLTAMRLASAIQLQTLAGVNGDAAVRRFRRLLARMNRQRLIARLDRPIGGARAGSAGFVYRLDIAGQRLFDSGSNVRRPWTPRLSWLNHALAVSQLYVELATASSAELQIFQPEPTCWRLFADGFGLAKILKPDAYVELTVGDFEVLAYIEVDQGTESPATLRQKLDTYRRFWLAGGAGQTGGVMPLVVWAVPDAKRLHVVQQLVGCLPLEAQALHQAVLQSDVVIRLGRPPP
jgi:hypothetical protein